MFKKRLMFTEEMIKAVKYIKVEENGITADLKLTPAAATYFGIDVEAFVLKGIWDPKKDKCFTDSRRYASYRSAAGYIPNADLVFGTYYQRNSKAFEG